MEAAHSQQQKLPNIMCGDHPSFITEVTDCKNKELKPETDTVKDKDKKIDSFHNISPCTSRDERLNAIRRPASEQELRALEHRRRLEPRIDAAIESALPAPTRALVHAAGGSARWAPHAVVVLALALLATHTLHALAAALAAALPVLRKVCKYCRKWTEESWRCSQQQHRWLYPAALALLTALLYSLYFVLYVGYAITVWAIQPLCEDEPCRERGPRDECLSSYDATAVKVTNYEDIPPKAAPTRD